MATFRQIVAKIQDGLLEEAKVGLDFALRLDPTFAPGLELQRQFASGRESVDLTALISHLEAPSTDSINLFLVEAVEEFNQRNYLEAKERVGKVLLDLPGHAEARNLLGQIDEALKVETQVGQFLTQAREAIDRGDPEEAANFVMMAQALDPHHRGIQGMLVKLQAPGPAPESSTRSPVGGSAPSPPPAPERRPEQDVGDLNGSRPAAQVETHPPEEPPSDSDEPDSWNIAKAFSFDEPESAESAGQPDSPHPATPSGEDDIADLFNIDSSGELAAEEEQEGLPNVAFAPSSHPAEGVPPSRTEPAPSAEPGGPAFDDSAGDLGDLFDSGADLGSQFAFDHEGDSSDQARDRTVQIQSLVEQATAAWEIGEIERARDLVESVLATDPGNFQALELVAKIDAADERPVPEPLAVTDSTAEEPVAESAPDDDPARDLYAHDIALPENVDRARLDEVPATAVAPGSRRGSPMKAPVRLGLLICGGVAIVLATMWLGRGFFDNKGNAEEERAQAVTRVLQEAETFIEQGKTEEALHLLQSFPAQGLEKERIDKRISRYQESLAPPPPTPIPEAFVRGRDLIDQGQWLDAFIEVDAGLRTNPNDSGLHALNEQIAAIEPEVVPLLSSLNNQDFATAASIASDLEKRHPDQSGFSRIRNRSLFNAALSDLRSYNLVGARNYLELLKSRQPQDSELDRILDFISSYSNRSVDMQLEIFVGSLQER